ELAAVLDHWAMIREPIKGRSDPSWKHLLRVARAADPDRFRDRVRQAHERLDLHALVELAKSDEAFRQPPRMVAFLGSAINGSGAFETAEALLMQARQGHPESFWINHELANSFTEARPARWDEAIRFYTAAVTIRPQSPGARFNLGFALSKKARLDEAIAEYQE